MKSKNPDFHFLGEVVDGEWFIVQIGKALRHIDTASNCCAPSLRSQYPMFSERRSTTALEKRDGNYIGVARCTTVFPFEIDKVHRAAVASTRILDQPVLTRDFV